LAPQLGKGESGEGNNQPEQERCTQRLSVVSPVLQLSSALLSPLCHTFSYPLLPLFPARVTYGRPGSMVWLRWSHWNHYHIPHLNLPKETGQLLLVAVVPSGPENKIQNPESPPHKTQPHSIIAPHSINIRLITKLREGTQEAMETFPAPTAGVQEQAVPVYSTGVSESKERNKTRPKFFSRFL